MCLLSYLLPCCFVLLFALCVVIPLVCKMCIVRAVVLCLFLCF